MRCAAAGEPEFALVRRSLADLTPEQAEDVLPFFEELLDISRMLVTLRAKFRRVIRLLLRSRRLWKVLRMLFNVLLDSVKGIASWAASWRPGFAMTCMLGGAAAGLAVFGAKSAGLAAMGGAIAVPLWLVTSAGSTMLAVLLSELRRAAGRRVTPPDVSPPGASTRASNVVPFVQSADARDSEPAPQDSVPRPPIISRTA